MAFGKLGQLFGFDDDYDDDEYEEYEDEEIEEVKPKATQTGTGKQLSIGRGKAPDCVFASPKRFEECFTIADKIKERNMVIINFNGVTPPIAHRLVDFLSGVAYACESQIKQIAKDTHVVIPSSCEYVDITAVLEQQIL